MNRYIIKFYFPAGYKLMDTKANEVVASFTELQLAQDYCNYLNKKEELIVFILKQVSDSVDEVFSGE